MKRRDFLKGMGIGAGLGLAGCVSLKGARRATRPNIVLCMADDQGWGDVGYYGHPVVKTPHLDEAAAAGLRFDRFYAAAPVCSPTRGSVMTGRHPNRFGCFQWGRTLQPQEVTLPEALKTAGYTTGHFGKWHLGPVYKDSPVNPGASGFDEWLSAPNFYDNDPILSREGVAEQMHGESSIIAVDAALDFIRRQAQAGQPFLAVVWFGSPHKPHQAAEEFRALYPDQTPALQDFYGEISGLDNAFGKLRNELSRLGIRDNTIVWYCSDNGGLPEVGSTGGRSHKASIYEGGLRVPAILEWPARIPQPRVTDLPCNTSDIFPTLLEIAGVEAPDSRPIDGVSLTPLIDGSMNARPRPMGFWNYPAKGIMTPSKEFMEELLAMQEAGQEMTDPERLWPDGARVAQQYPEDSFPGHAAWLDWPWKLHRIQDESGAATFELYNLEDDPNETEDVFGRSVEHIALEPALESWLVSVVRSLNGKDYA
jgi:arylsulfatase A-like enzyme